MLGAVLNKFLKEFTCLNSSLLWLLACSPLALSPKLPLLLRLPLLSQPLPLLLLPPQLLHLQKQK
jgi:hypothetical protein